MRVRVPALAPDVIEAAPPPAAKARGVRDDAAADHAQRVEGAYRDHASQVWRTLARLGVPAADLDDAMQDVFTVVHRKLDSFEGRSSLRTWIYGIALRVARKRRSRREPPASLDGEPIDRGTSPFDDLVALEGMELFDAIVSQMDEGKRLVFVLREVEQLSAPEISKITGVKLFTVYSRLRAAKRIFNDALAERGLASGREP